MSQVYANILESLTSGLYNEVNFAVREYLQNAYDAIKAAQKFDIIKPDEDYHVAVDVNHENTIITITDNGVGMDESTIREYTSIGGGTKTDPDYAGHKGIGKLSGLRFFDTFIVQTKMANTEHAFRLIWECGTMMNALLASPEDMKKTPYSEFIKNFYHIEKLKSKDGKEHYTQVQLINARSEFRHQINEKSIGNYIKKNCPVPFYEDKFRYSKEIADYLQQDVNFINTQINGKIIYQNYRDQYNLVPPMFHTLKYNNKYRGKVWLSWVKDESGIIEHDEIRGLCFRCKGIRVGDSNLFANNCMPPGRSELASWFTGEIIVTDDSIKPSTARDDFWKGSDSKKFFEELRKQIGKKLSMLADTRSEINATKQLISQLKDNKKVSIALSGKVKTKLKRLKNHKLKDEPRLNFAIVEVLESVMSQKEQDEVKSIPRVEDKVKTVVESGNKSKLVDVLLDVHEQKINATSKKAQEKLQEQIECVTSALTTQNESNTSKVEELNVRTTLEEITDLLVKYLISRKIDYEIQDVRQFVYDRLNDEEH